MSIDRTTLIDPQAATADPAGHATRDDVAHDEATARASSQYTHENIKHLRDAAHIRQRPGMYIGDTGASGLHHLVYELVYNSVDEALAGHCRLIHVKINLDGSLSVGDDGRGIPVDLHPEIGVPTLQAVMTLVGAGGKFDKRAYKTSAGLHGMGAKAVNALSEWTKAEVRRGGKVYVQEYERGKPTTDVTVLGVATRTGTTITFRPDPTIFHNVGFDYDTLEARFRELGFLNKGLAIRLTDERPATDGATRDETFKYDGGLAQFVEYLNRSEEPLHPPIYVDRTVDEVRVEAAIQYTASDEERIRCYTNNAYNSVGGTHLSGFKAAVTRTLNAYGNKENLFKNGLTPVGDDFREGMTAVISVQVPEPQFESNSKLKLNNPEVEGIVTSVLNEQLAKYLEENPKDAARVMKKVVLAAEAREAAAKARKALKDRKNILSGGGLPGKLMDCTSRNRDESELFLVEGDSAGGSAESGRDRVYQAILPLRGKPLNVEKAISQKMLSNEEICSIISAVGIDIGNSDDLTRLRYNKIVILTDADVDGQHIRTLLLTFFYRQMRRLVEEGHIFVARPPLFRVEQKKTVRYVQAEDEMNADLIQRGVNKTKLLLAAPQPEGAAAGAPVAIAKTFEGDDLTRLMQTLTELEGPLSVLERRGQNLIAFLAKAAAGPLPIYRVLLGNRETWFTTRTDVDAFRQAEQQRLGRELVVADEVTAGQPQAAPQAAAQAALAAGSPAPAQHLLAVQEFHEVRWINRGLEKLKTIGLSASDLIPQPRLAGREPPPRFLLAAEGKQRPLLHLRELISEVRKLGQSDLKIVRFKGLGEMDYKELWDTTLDPNQRTLLKVQQEDALKADEMFRTLMGEKVEPRRDFIQKHALEVKDIDYHGA